MWAGGLGEKASGFSSLGFTDVGLWASGLLELRGLREVRAVEQFGSIRCTASLRGQRSGVLGLCIQNDISDSFRNSRPFQTNQGQGILLRTATETLRTPFREKSCLIGISSLTNNTRAGDQQLLRRLASVQLLGQETQQDGPFFKGAAYRITLDVEASPLRPSSPQTS